MMIEVYLMLEEEESPRPQQRGPNFMRCAVGGNTDTFAGMARRLTRRNISTVSRSDLA